MDSQKKYSNNHGRKPKPDKMRHRYVFRLDDGDNARFLALFDESGKATRAEFIVSALFGREIKVRATLSGNVNNVLDQEYIADARDGSAHDWESATRVLYGFGRTYSVRLKFNF